MAQGRNLREVGARVEVLLGELRSVAEPAVQHKAEEVVRLLMEFYGAGLERIVEIVAADERADALAVQFADDQLVSGLLALHGLHPVPVETRIQQALDKVRPYLGSHAGGVEFLGVDAEGICHLRLQGSCDGCPSSTLTVKLAIERAIEEAAPELSSIDVEGVTAPSSTGGLVQIESLQREESGEPPPVRWTHVGTVDMLLPGQMTALDVGGASVLLLNAATSLYAYRNACAACGSALDSGTLKRTVLRCPSCGSAFDVQLAGRGVDDPDVHLDPLPLLADEHSVRVAMPAGVTQ
jgi:Fe-S cluster biogenesis protein NfuA/nitrite reductase/ring-hydroxylating ferredoxin subunit